jgi:hypothetical protein
MLGADPIVVVTEIGVADAAPGNFHDHVARSWDGLNSALTSGAPGLVINHRTAAFIVSLRTLVSVLNISHDATAVALTQDKSRDLIPIVNAGMNA